MRRQHGGAIQTVRQASGRGLGDREGGGRWCSHAERGSGQVFIGQQLGWRVTIWSQPTVVASPIVIVVMMIASQSHGVTMHHGAAIIGVSVGRRQQARQGNAEHRDEGDQTGVA